MPVALVATVSAAALIAALWFIAVLRRRAAETARALEAAREARAETERTNQRLLDFANVSSDWFWEQDAELRFTFLSASVFRHSGMAPEEHYGKTRQETRPDGVSDQDWAQHEARLARRQPFQDFRCVRTTADGGRRHLSISGVPVFDGDGEFRGYRGVGRDITEIVRAEQRAADINGRLMQAIDSRSEGLAFWDQDDRLVICNQAYRRQAGDARDALVPGVAFSDYIRHSAELSEFGETGDDVEAVVADRLARRTRLPQNFELFRSGCWLLIHEQRTADDGVLVTATDITELKRREAALCEAVTQADIANRAKMNFLATMSHELRTPLNAIIGFAEVLRARQTQIDPAQSVEYATYIHESGSHLLSVINDLLDVSRIEAGKRNLDETYCRLPDLLAECERMIRNRAEANGLALEFDTAKAAECLWIDHRAIKQVLINLLSNSVKFTGPGGRIRVVADRDADGRPRIAVSDTGVGIARELIPGLFEPFRQLENALDRAHSGTGLGLYIVKNLVEAHGGSVTLRSTPGEGTEITMVLPTDRVVDLPRRHLAAIGGQLDVKSPVRVPSA